MSSGLGSGQLANVPGQGTYKRFDNRDVGLSTHLADAPIGPKGERYLLSDMAADAVAVLDAAGFEAAHVLGRSLGGMIAQQMAIDHPHRVLTSVSALANT